MNRLTEVPTIIGPKRGYGQHGYVIIGLVADSPSSDESGATVRSEGSIRWLNMFAG